MLRMIILSHNMACHDFDTFIDQELGTIGQGGCSPVPSARTGMAGLLCRLQGCFGIGIGNPSAGVFGLSYRPTRHKTRLIVLARPAAAPQPRGGGHRGGLLRLRTHPTADSGFLYSAAVQRPAYQSAVSAVAGR